ncbi:MAG: DUF2782 domain-containing protein [Rhodocyclaceae bacterium]|nr:DUF2782 domain-containing protein [Rhodocyclaceae bacterium]MDP1956723.1 DUF2782 domain-containing protein [Rhodocyclaceae bacterium]
MRPHSFRLSLLALLCATALSAVAQTRPADLQPLPEPPPPPPGLIDSALEPQVTIIKRGEDRVEEFRMGGKLYMIKVTPPHGTPYYLIDPKGDGGFVRQDLGDKSLSVPMWVIRSF